MVTVWKKFPTVWASAPSKAYPVKRRTVSNDCVHYCPKEKRPNSLAGLLDLDIPKRLIASQTIPSVTSSWLGDPSDDSSSSEICCVSYIWILVPEG